MKRILLRSPKGPFELASPEETLVRNLIASNSGNLVFLEAAHKVLATTGTEVIPDRLEVNPRRAGEINERYDAYVIPLANAFRLSFESDLILMTRLIERLRIPVVILGVGAQSNLQYQLDRLRPIERSVRAFARAVLERSPSIGVRGELTQAYLQGLGFRDVEVIGCPSMFLYGDSLRVEKRAERLDRDARVALTVSPYVKRMGDIVESHVRRYPNLVYIAQDIDTLELLLWGETKAAAAQTSKVPVHTSHPLFAENRIRFYIDPWPWIADLRTFGFSFGTRIHGAIAAILAGTPAYVFAHDSRTLELVRYFGIPHRPMPAVPPDVDAADLYAEADFGELNRGHATRFATFLDYLRRNGLETVFAEGADGSSFDAQIASTGFPPAVDAAAMATRPRGVRATARRLRYRLRSLGRIQRVRQLRVAALRRWAGSAGHDRPEEAHGAGSAEEA